MLASERLCSLRKYTAWTFVLDALLYKRTELRKEFSDGHLPISLTDPHGFTKVADLKALF